MLSVVWWMAQRLPTLRCSWRPTKPGRSAVNWLWRPGGLDDPCTISTAQWKMVSPRAKLGTAYRTWPRQTGEAISRAQHRGAALRRPRYTAWSHSVAPGYGLPPEERGHGCSYDGF